jgi:hypothetical protein
MNCLALIATLVVACSSPVLAYPKLWSSMPDTCMGPTAKQDDHGAPVVSTDIVFSLVTEDMTPVSSWVPSTPYVLTVSHPWPGNMYVYTDSGAFSSTTAPTDGTTVTEADCDMRAWYSNEDSPTSTKTLNWQAPACCSVDTVTMQATFASGQMATYQQADTTFARYSGSA